jgi:hypothetical protein
MRRVTTGSADGSAVARERVRARYAAAAGQAAAGQTPSCLVYLDRGRDTVAVEDEIQAGARWCAATRSRADSAPGPLPDRLSILRSRTPLGDAKAGRSSLCDSS